MKAAVIHGFGQPLQIEEMQVKEPGENQVLVKVIACGVCHTDLHACQGDWPAKPKMPLIPGHEALGYVVALGRGVKKVKEGHVVGVPWLYTCGCCELYNRMGNTLRHTTKPRLQCRWRFWPNMWLPIRGTWHISWPILTLQQWHQLFALV